MLPVVQMVDHQRGQSGRLLAEADGVGVEVVEEELGNAVVVVEEVEVIGWWGCRFP